MSLSFCSLIAKPCSMINGSNRKPCCGRTRFGVIIRSEVNVAPKQRGIPQLSKQGVPLAVQEVVHRQSQIISPCSKLKPLFKPIFLNDAYEMCRNICAEYAKTFYLGTQLQSKSTLFLICVTAIWLTQPINSKLTRTLLMTEETQKAICAIYGKLIYNTRIANNQIMRQLCIVRETFTEILASLQFGAGGWMDLLMILTRCI